VIGLTLVLVGCNFLKGPNRVLPLPPNVDPEQVIDADEPLESVTPLRPDDLAEVGRAIQAERLRVLQQEVEDWKKRGITPPTRRKYNILACSGGAVYGAYSAGVLCGWTESGLPPDQGGRPEFDVVTGISTGALIAPFAFLGSEFDPVLRREYTTTRTEDIFSRQRSIRRVFSQSLVDNTPFRERIERALSPVVLSRIAAEHEKGRRLFIGTTNLDTKRIVLWDVGAIAKRGTPEAAKLVHDVVLASASIPGLFPPVKITVTIDGQQYEELHVDGSVTRSLFFRPPYQPPAERASFGPNSLAGSNLYVLVAGKINPAPNAVRVRTLPLALEATSTLLYSLTRGDLYRMYTYCLLTGMNLRVSAIPEDTPAPTKSAEFDPVEMTKLFEAGRESGRRGDVTRPGKEGASEDTAWRDVPPGLKGGEKQGLRTGLNLTVRPKEAGEGAATRGPEADKGAIVPPVPPIR
jgi:predicted acylesterase/phospholipase RssA